jgi:hypothetical protein
MEYWSDAVLECWVVKGWSGKLTVRAEMRELLLGGSRC